MADEASEEEEQEPGVELVGPSGEPRVEQAMARLQGPPTQLEASFKVCRMVFFFHNNGSEAPTLLLEWVVCSGHCCLSG